MYSIRLFSRKWINGTLLIALPLCALQVVDAQADIKVQMVNTLPAAGGNNFYIGNRDPLFPSPLIKLPCGRIKPSGWLRRQLELEADGFTGHLTEISKFCQFDRSAWTNPQGKGELGWEEVPYWLKGFISLGHILKNERIINQAQRWVEAVLNSQWENGYFGWDQNYKNHDYWPNMIMLYVLRSHYEATGDKRVIPFMTNYFRYQSKLPLDKLFPRDAKGRTWWQGIRAADNLDSIYWLYNRTGHKWLLDLARINHQRTQDWTGGFPSWHGVNITECFRGPAQYYQQTHDKRYLEATKLRYDTVVAIYGQAPGGMFGADENCREGYTGPRQAAESCSIVEFMHSHEMLTRITGDPIWADRCEEIAFNSLPPTMTPDLKGLHYLTAPNQVQLDRPNKSPLIQNKGDMFSYNPHRYRCCQHNISHGWPYFAENLWMATAGNGLAAALYADCEVTAKVGDGTEVRIIESTDYPFRGTIEFKLIIPKPVKFPLSLRMPGWCNNAQVRINSEKKHKITQPLSWIILDRLWENGDTVHLHLLQKIKVKVWNKNKNALSVSRGPLAYSLKIEHQRSQYGDNPKWPAYEIFPNSPWNYGLIVNLKKPEKSFQVIKSNKPLAAQPFTVDGTSVQLLAKGKRIPQWQLEDNGLIGPLPQSPLHSDQPVEDITLIPMGCARLRLSVFPQIEK